MHVVEWILAGVTGVTVSVVLSAVASVLVPFFQRRFVGALAISIVLTGWLGYMWLSAPVSLMGS